MTTDPRVALAGLVSALERHLEASASRHGENDPTVVAAYQDVADAFDLYDDALLDAYGEVTPLEIYGADEEDDDFDDEDDEDDTDEDDEDDTDELDGHEDEDGGAAAVYLGLDDTEYDADDNADDSADDGADSADADADSDDTTELDPMRGERFAHPV